MRVPEPHLAATVALLGALAASAIFDVRRRRIPNRLVAAIALGGLSHAGLIGGAASLGAALCGLAVGAGLLIVPFALGLMGAGDLKLLAAVGAWVGSLGVVYVLVGAALIGGALSLIAIASLDAVERASVRDNLTALVLLRQPGAISPSEISRRRGVPFGVAIALATAVALLAGVAS